MCVCGGRGGGEGGRSVTEGGRWLIVTQASILFNFLLCLLVQQVHLREHIDVRQLQGYHGRQRCHDPSKKLRGLDEELGVEEKDTTQTKVPSLKLVHYLPHDWDMCVQLYLSCRPSS